MSILENYTCGVPSKRRRNFIKVATRLSGVTPVKLATTLVNLKSNLEMSLNLEKFIFVTCGKITFLLL